jgi:hypothetical protein
MLDFVWIPEVVVSLLIHFETSGYRQDLVVFRKLEHIIIGVSSIFFEEFVIMAPPERVIEDVLVNGLTENSVVPASANYKVPLLALVEHVLDILFLLVDFHGVLSVLCLFYDCHQFLLGVIDARKRVF